MKSSRAIQCFQWAGPQAMFLDRPDVALCGDVVIGRYGGHIAAGAASNEDGALVWAAPDGEWEFAMILDAHAGAESAELVLDTIAGEHAFIVEILSRPVESALPQIKDHLVGLFRSEAFRAQCRAVQGETACLVCARKGGFLWWLNVGDCLLCLHHPELAAFGQITLNQRSFYEWIGQVNTFDLPVACYSSGVRELRGGRNVILLCTDGLLDEQPASDFATVTSGIGLEQHILGALSRVHDNQGRDSATVIAWVHDNDDTAAYPSTS